MKKYYVSQIIYVTLLLFTFNLITAQGWIKHYPDVGDSFASDMTPTPDGGFLLAGDITSANGTYENLIRTDDMGNVSWIVEQDTAVKAYSVYANSDDTYLLGGFYNSDSLGLLPYVQLADSSGSIIWEYIDYTSSANYFLDVIGTSDGGALACGVGTNNIPGCNDCNVAFATKLDANGNESWTYLWYTTNLYFSYGRGGYEEANGNFIFIGDYGASVSGNAELNVFWTRLDSSGNLLQEELYSFPDESDYTFDYDVDDQGNFWLTGQSIVTATNAWAPNVFKIDSNGQLLGRQIYTNYSNWLGNGITATSDGGAVITGLFTENFQSTWLTFKVGQNLDIQWINEFNWLGSSNSRGNSIAALPGGHLAIFGTVDVEPELSKMTLMKTDSLGNLFSQTLFGNVFADENNNCLLDTLEPSFENWIIQISNPGSTYFSSTDANGQYYIPIDTGNHSIELIYDVPYWNPCVNPINVNVAPASDTVMVDFPLQANILCPFLTVDISTPFLRRCFPNTYSVNYCNYGTAVAEDTYLEITFDQYINVDSSDVPWSSVQGDTYTFLLDSVAIGECDGFNIYTTMACDTSIIGFTHCVEAHIYPDSLCTPDSATWTGASIDVSAECDGDSVYFIITNVGQGDMTEHLNFIVIEDHLMLMNFPDSFFLDSGDSLIITVPANGSTYYLGSEQAFGHPGFNIPSIAIEGCGTDSNGNVSLGFVTQFQENDGDPFVSIDCQENIGAWDPNDKRGFPKGYGSDHLIEPNTDIEYHIRFQNTGTDTAFTVEIRDTLSAFLDPSSIKVGASSHDYDFRLQADGSLSFIFNNIMLPDSNVNEVASHGFVKFRISQYPDNPVGTEFFNQAAIYFDFNPPVFTNETVHRIGVDFIEMEVVSVHEPGFDAKDLNLYPNPFEHRATFEWDGEPFENARFIIFDAMGRKVMNKLINGNKWEVERNNLSAGLYFFTLESHKERLITGRMIVK